MSQDTPRNPITLKGLVFSIAGADTVEVHREVPFTGADGGMLAMDVYYPPGKAGRAPLVVMVEGFNDVGFQRMLGCRFMDMASVEGWGRLVAASGMVAVAYSNRSPLADAHAVIQHLRQHATALGLNPDRIGVLASSGHSPVALSVVMADRRLRCAALLYPYSMDLDGSSAVADAQKVFKFDNPAEGKSIDDLPADLPIFIARAGKDQMPRLNEALDRFVASAQAKRLPVTLMNHPDGPHAFDLMDDSERSRELIGNTLAFLRQWLA